MQFLPSVLAYQSSLPTVTAAPAVLAPHAPATVTAAPVVLAPHAPAAVTAAPVVLAPHAPATVFTTAPVVLASVAPTPDIPATPVVLAPTAPATVVAAVPVVLAPPAPTLVISAAPASLVPIPPSPVVTPPSLPVSFAAVVAPPVLPNDTMVIDDDSDTDEDTATLIATVMTALRQARKRKPSPAPVPRAVVPPVAVAVPAPAPITSAPAVVTTTAPIVAEPVRVHGGPRVPSPTKYSGADNEIVEDFIFTFENYLTASGVPRAAWPSHVLHLLTGKALNAWLAVARPMQLLGEPVTWELLTHTLLQTFPHHDLALAARKRLHAIEQTGRVQDYLQLVRTLVSRAGSPATSDTDLLLMFWKGLKQSIKDQAKVDPRRALGGLHLRIWQSIVLHLTCHLSLLLELVCTMLLPNSPLNVHSLLFLLLSPTNCSTSRLLAVVVDVLVGMALVVVAAVVVEAVAHSLVQISTSLR